MFEGFRVICARVAGCALRVKAGGHRAGGHGPAVLLLHGHPRTREDYRAGLTVDRAADEADLAAGRRISAPLLFGRAEHDDMKQLYDDPAALRRQSTAEVTEVSIPCGHHMAEEAPDLLATILVDFLTRVSDTPTTTHADRVRP